MENHIDSKTSPPPLFSNALIIMNPNSGGQRQKFQWGRHLLGLKKVTTSYGSKEHLMDAIINEFDFHNINTQGKFTDRPGHATILAKQAVTDGKDAVIVVGGDGTINEVINGLANTKVILGVIPFGTANVFGISFNLESDIKCACKSILYGQKKAIDLGRINGTYFACMAGVGFDAFVIQKADKTLKKFFGALSYLIVALWEVIRYRFYPILFTIDNNLTPIKGYFLVVCNTKYYGGDLIIAPDANCTDGKLDACIFTGKGLWSIIWYGIQMKLGNVKNSKFITVIQCNHIRIRRFGQHSIHADAEYIGETPATISIVKDALTIATNA